MSQRHHPSRRVPAWRRALRGTPPHLRPGDERGSMPLALLLTVVAIGLSGVLASTVGQQVSATRLTEHRVQALSVAQAGLDVGLARMRAAADGGGGNPALLPCGALSGSVPQATGSRYDVLVDYFLVDPAGRQSDPQWITNNRLACTQGPTVTPVYALLRSTGTGLDKLGTRDDADRRALYATYTFSTTDENIPGGRIPVVGSTQNLCLGTVNAPQQSKGQPVHAVPCTSEWQRITFAYPTSIQLRLVQSRSMQYPEGLCIDAAEQTPGTTVTFEPCADGPTEPRQRWRFSADQFYLEGTSDNLTGSDSCLSLAQTDTVNSTIVMVSGSGGGPKCGHKGPKGFAAFYPTPKVGPGSAGPITKQLVNYGEVGRCLDLPDDDVTGATSKAMQSNEGLALITYPCKQTFTGLPHWNHVFTYPAAPTDGSTVSGTISVTPGIPASTPAETPDPEWHVPYCLKSPGPAGGYVWVTRCSTAVPSDVTWFTTGETELVETSYRILDTYGNCLQSVGAGASHADKHNDFARVITAACSEDPESLVYQKWNVPAQLHSAPLKDYGEQ